MSLRVDIEKKLGNFTLRQKFEVGNEVLALLGASGCGKSMTLKCIAGIEKPDRGRIVLDGMTLFDSEKRINLPPQSRKVGYLFQQYALFPNMTVLQNITCGVRDKKQAAKVVPDMVRAMHLDGLENKRPAQLSGGQQQRVALARILVNTPDILMLDEPFSALDSHLRFQLEQELRETIRKFGKTVLLVSHDRDEVFRISDRIAVLNDGHIETIGNKHDIFLDPVTKNGATLTGCKNISAVKPVDATHVDALEWGIRLQTRPRPEGVTHIGIRMHDITTDGEINPVRCRVLQEIENPFSYTVMLCPVEHPDAIPFGLAVDKSRWQNIRNTELTIYLHPDALLLLRDNQ